MEVTYHIIIPLTVQFRHCPLQIPHSTWCRHCSFVWSFDFRANNGEGYAFEMGYRAFTFLAFVKEGSEGLLISYEVIRPRRRTVVAALVGKVVGIGSLRPEEEGDRDDLLPGLRSPERRCRTTTKKYCLDWILSRTASSSVICVEDILGR